MPKVVILNGSPRKNFNTAKLLQEAKRGAEAVGADVEYVNLVDLNYKGCMSCFACKRKGAVTNGLCAIRDELRPVLESILNADAVIIGSPVYYSYPTGMFRNLLERMLFAAGTYMKDENGAFKRILKRNIPVGIIFTMNCPEKLSEQIGYPEILNANAAALRMIYGYCDVLNSYDTYQFSDYSKYDCDYFDEQHKAEVREKQFPIDMENAFNLGKKLVQISI